MSREEDDNLIASRLAELERARKELETKIAESQTVLNDLDLKMKDMKQRQRDRMQADDRVDNKLIDSIQQTDEES